ncbi:MAG TPA: STAS domain-containing protein [Terriglobales bacterium]|nr:STAS domain-containing protein [Terriglobales bacterium]
MRIEHATPVSSSKSAGRSAAEPVAEKILKVSMESAQLGTAVVLHCLDRAILRNDGRALASLIAEVLPSARRMIVDLGAVLSLDSGALGELAMIHMWAEASGYGLTFANLSDEVRAIFESTNLISVFDVYPSVETAIADLQPEQEQTA